MRDRYGWRECRKRRSGFLRARRAYSGRCVSFQQDMFRGLVAVGNDVDRNGNIHTGSILIESKTFAGS